MITVSLSGTLLRLRSTSGCAAGSRLTDPGCSTLANSAAPACKTLPGLLTVKQRTLCYSPYQTVGKVLVLLPVLGVWEVFEVQRLVIDKLTDPDCSTTHARPCLKLALSEAVAQQVSETDVQSRQVSETDVQSRHPSDLLSLKDCSHQSGSEKESKAARCRGRHALRNSTSDSARFVPGMHSVFPWIGFDLAAQDPRASVTLTALICTCGCIARAVAMHVQCNR
eukprot:2371859-Rhodomonas_salina.2